MSFFKKNQFFRLFKIEIFGISAILYSLILKYLLILFTQNESFVSYLPISFLEYIIGFFTFILILLFYFFIFRDTILNGKIKILALLLFLFSCWLLLHLYTSGNVKYIIPSFIIIYGGFTFLLNVFNEKFQNLFTTIILFTGIIALIFPQFQILFFSIALGIIPLLYGQLLRFVKN